MGGVENLLLKQQSNMCSAAGGAGRRAGRGVPGERSCGRHVRRAQAGAPPGPAHRVLCRSEFSSTEAHSSALPPLAVPVSMTRSAGDASNRAHVW